MDRTSPEFFDRNYIAIELIRSAVYKHFQWRFEKKYEDEIVNATIISGSTVHQLLNSDLMVSQIHEFYPTTVTPRFSPHV